MGSPIASIGLGLSVLACMGCGDGAGAELAGMWDLVPGSGTESFAPGEMELRDDYTGDAWLKGAHWLIEWREGIETAYVLDIFQHDDLREEVIVYMFTGFCAFDGVTLACFTQSGFRFDWARR